MTLSGSFFIYGNNAIMKTIEKFSNLLQINVEYYRIINNN